MEAYVRLQEAANAKARSASESLRDAQKSFANKNGILLLESDEKDEITENIIYSNRLLKYTNDLSLAFYKVYFQESVVMNAISEGDVTTLETALPKLDERTEEGLQYVGTISAFEGDDALRLSTKKAILYFESESKNEFQDLKAFYEKQAEMTKLEKHLSGLGGKATKEDIDEFNAAVKEFNALAQKANGIMEKLNDKRSNAFDAYNEAVNTFTEKHSR